MTRDKRLKCTISKGMFSDESCVTVTCRTGEMLSFFISNAYIDKDTSSVYIALSNDGMYASLPDDYQSVVPVNPCQLI